MVGGSIKPPNACLTILIPPGIQDGNIINNSQQNGILLTHGGLYFKHTLQDNSTMIGTTTCREEMNETYLA